MPNNVSPGPSWKNPGGGNGGNSGGRPAVSRKSWQPAAAPAKPATVKRRSRGRGAIVATMFGGALVALIVIVIEWFRPPKPPALIAAGGGPSETLASPLAVYAANDAQSLA